MTQPSSPPPSVLTRHERIALYVGAVSSLITASVLVASMVTTPCDPAPPKHPVPAAQ